MLFRSVTNATHAAPRLGFLLALTGDGKTLLKGGVGMFYDRVPLMVPTFEHLPDRTVSILDANGNVSSSTFYLNRLSRQLQNPQSTSWNVAVERQVVAPLSVRVGYEQRNTTKVFVVSPISEGNAGVLALTNIGRDSYQEFQVAARYQLPRFTLNGSYVRSREIGRAHV